ncbi:MAG: DUF1449 family protein [Chloroflexi bacterium]|nr:DUF1449 family protein [Chloroflexota bacterium]
MLTETLAAIFAWYNLPFTIMLLFCGVLTALQLIGLGGDGDADADLDADFDADVDLDADLDADIDLDADADVDVDADAGGLSEMLSILAFVGVGKAPLLVVLLILLGSIGILGWTVNSLILAVFSSYPAWAFIVSLLVALIGGSLVSSRLARLIGRALPSISSTATAATGLVGRRGTVISSRVDGAYGLVRVRDQGGTLINVFAITAEDEPIGSQAEVALVEYDTQKKRYMVVPIGRR